LTDANFENESNIDPTIKHVLVTVSQTNSGHLFFKPDEKFVERLLFCSEDDFNKTGEGLAAEWASFMNEMFLDAALARKALKNKKPGE